jgi:hypothetical protein
MLLMKFPNLTLRSRIVIAVAAIALIHALFQWVPGYIERRPRFYEEAWTRAIEILKEEVGSAAVENGVFHIPREEISVASIGGAWQRFAGWHFMVLPGGDALLVTPEPRISHISGERAQRLLAVFRYLLLVRVSSMPEIDDENGNAGFTIFDGRRVLSEDDWVDSDSPLPVRVRANAAERLCRSLAKSDDLTLVEEEDETAAALCRAAGHCRRIRNRFEAALLEFAANGLCEYPTAGAVPALAKIKRLVDTLENRSNWLDTLEDVPVIGRFFGWGQSQDWREVDVDDALWACEHLAGRSEAEQLAVYEEELFTKEESAVRPCRFIREYPDDFTAFALKHWDSLSSDNRSLYFMCARRCGDGGRAVAEKFLDSEDLSDRVNAKCVLFKTTGDLRYLAASLEELRPPDDPAALSNDERYEFQNAIRVLAPLDDEDPVSEEIASCFRDHWRSLSEADLEWDAMRDFGAQNVCTALIAAGGRENIEIAMEIVRKEDEKTQFYAASRYATWWNPQLWCTNALLQSKDPLVADAILEYVRGELPQLKRSAWFSLSRVLALKGDERLAALFKEALPRVEAGEPQASFRRTGSGTTEYSRSEILKSLIAVVEAVNAEDPVLFLLEVPDEDRELVTNLGGTDLLAAYTEDQILALMAEDRCEPLLSLLYEALLARRADDTAD